MVAAMSLDSSDYDLPGTSSGIVLQSWYHGTVSRVGAEESVKRSGDFLVRDSISKRGDYVLTAKWKDKALHFQVNSTVEAGRKMFHFEDESFASVVDLINFYVTHKRAVTFASQCVISNPVSKSEQTDTSIPSNEIEASYMRVFHNGKSPSSSRPLQQQVRLNQANRFQRPASSISQLNLSTISMPVPPLPASLRYQALPIPIPTKSEQDYDDGHDYCEMDYDAMDDSDPLDARSFSVSRLAASRPQWSSCHNLTHVISRTPTPLSSCTIAKHTEPKPQVPPKPKSIILTPAAKLQEEDEYDSVRTSIGYIGADESDYDVPLECRPYKDPRDSGVYESPSPPRDRPMFSMPLLLQLKTFLQKGSVRDVAEAILKEDGAVLEANHLQHSDKNNRGQFITNGFYKMLLPEGITIRKNIIERSRLTVLTVVLSIVSGQDVACLRTWIHTARLLLELGDFFGFVNVMDGVMCNMIKKDRKLWDGLEPYDRIVLENVKASYSEILREGTSSTFRGTVCIPFLQPILEIMSSGESQFLDHTTYSCQLDTMFKWMDQARSWKFVEIQSNLISRLQDFKSRPSDNVLDHLHTSQLILEPFKDYFEDQKYNAAIKRLEFMANNQL